MKVVSKHLGEKVEEVHIYPLADLHLGSPKCKVTKIKEVIEKIKEDPKGYCILLGDLIDNPTTASVGDTYSETLSPMEQIKTVTEMFRPIKDRILAVTSGNHEFRSYKSDGIDLVYFFCAELGIADVYDSASCVLSLHFGKNVRIQKTHKCHEMSYSLFLSHGSGGGRTPGSKANALQRASDVVNTDVVVLGHQHVPMSFIDAHFELDQRSEKVNLRETLMVMCSSFLDYENYAERYLFRPSAIALPMIVLDGKPAQGKKKMTCVITTL